MSRTVHSCFQNPVWDGEYLFWLVRDGLTSLSWRVVQDLQTRGENRKLFGGHSENPRAGRFTGTEEFTPGSLRVINRFVSMQPEAQKNA